MRKQQLSRSQAHFLWVCAVIWYVCLLLQALGKCLESQWQEQLSALVELCFDPVPTPQKPLSEEQERVSCLVFLSLMGSGVPLCGTSPNFQCAHVHLEQKPQGKMNLN